MHAPRIIKAVTQKYAAAPPAMTPSPTASLAKPPALKPMVTGGAAPAAAKPLVPSRPAAPSPAMAQMQGRQNLATNQMGAQPTTAPVVRPAAPMPAGRPQVDPATFAKMRAQQSQNQPAPAPNMAATPTGQTRAQQIAASAAASGQPSQSSFTTPGRQQVDPATFAQMREQQQQQQLQATADAQRQQDAQNSFMTPAARQRAEMNRQNQLAAAGITEPAQAPTDQSAPPTASGRQQVDPATFAQMREQQQQQQQQTAQTQKPQQAQPGFNNTRAHWGDRYGRDAQGNALTPTHPEAQKAVTARLGDESRPIAERTAEGKQVLQDVVEAAGPEAKQGLQDLSAGNKDTPAAQQLQSKSDAAIEQEAKNRISEKMQQDPNMTPQQAGEMMNDIMQSFNNMPEPMKWMMGLGLGGGLLGVLGGMFGGGGGMGLLGVLGLGAAGLAGAAGGMFGQGAQDTLGGALGSIGQATGMIPKNMDLSALKGDDAVGKAVADSSGGGILGGLKAWWDPKGTAKAVQGKLDSANNLQRLMAVPEGMRAGLLKQISPNSSPAEIQQMLANAKSLHGAMNDPKHQLSQNMAKSRSFAADPEKYIRNNSWFGSAVGSSLTDPDQRGWGSDMLAYSNPITGTATGLYDMGRNAYEGDWWGVGRGALNTASSFIPGGSLLKGLGRAGIQGVSHMMKPASDQRAIALTKQWLKEARCWKGYEPVPGKAPYSENSCRPIGSKKKSKKKTEKKAEDVVNEWLKKYRARGQKGRWVTTQRSQKAERKISQN